ncbi:MAG: hypothetical protein K2Q06_09530 [Parvularculaceae bacterium]|nr:hypothetical protein [Parvularculaceae bacterium]
MNFILKYAPNVLALFMSGVFLDSLRYKFTDHPKTQVIFGRLNDWATTLGLPGLFAHTGLFSQYVIGTAELFASALLLIGMLPRYGHLQALGALIGLAVMTGAVNFHLWTPLTTDPNNDGGGLFVAACLVLVSCVVMLLVFRRKEFFTLLARLGAVIAPL